MHRLLPVGHVDGPRSPEEAEPAHGRASDEDGFEQTARDLSEHIDLDHRQPPLPIRQSGCR